MMICAIIYLTVSLKIQKPLTEIRSLKRESQYMFNNSQIIEGNQRVWIKLDIRKTNIRLLSKKD